MTDINKLCDELEALLKKATPFAYVYHFASPFGGERLSLSSDEWNGQKPISTTPVYADASLRNAAQPLIDAARESVKKDERIKELEQELKERGG